MNLLDKSKWDADKNRKKVHTYTKNRKKMFLLNVLEKHGIDCHGQERKQKKNHKR